jgi:hypothetical protein
MKFENCAESDGYYTHAIVRIVRIPGPGAATELERWQSRSVKRIVRVYLTVEKSALITTDESLGVGQVLPGFVPGLSPMLGLGPIAPISLN